MPMASCCGVFAASRERHSGSKANRRDDVTAEPCLGCEFMVYRSARRERGVPRLLPRKGKRHETRARAPYIDRARAAADRSQRVHTEAQEASTGTRRIPSTQRHRRRDRHALSHHLDAKLFAAKPRASRRCAPTAGEAHWRLPGALPHALGWVRYEAGSVSPARATERESSLSVCRAARCARGCDRRRARRWRQANGCESAPPRRPPGR